MKFLASAISVAVLLGAFASQAPAKEPDREALVTTVDGIALQPCGLFGPSKRELMQRMIENQHQALHQAQASHATLSRIEVEQARQTELLRQIAGQTARAAEAGVKAADGLQDMRQHLIDRPLRAYKPGPSDAPGDVRGLPDVAPTMPDLRSMKPGPSDAPGDLKSVPDINIEGPILQGTRGKTYFVKSRTVPARQPATGSRYTGYSLRN